MTRLPLKCGGQQCTQILTPGLQDTTPRVVPSMSSQSLPPTSLRRATSAEDTLNNLLPPPSLNLRILHLLTLIKPPPRIKINSLRIHPLTIPIINLRANIQNQHSHNGTIHREEVFRRGLLAQRPHGEVELGDDQDDAPGQAPVGAPGPGPGFPGQIVDGAALDFPGVAHADVGEADHAPAKKSEE